jgi:hypothetical protein
MGYTPLLWAVNLGHIRIVAILIEAGANVNVTDEVGFTALHISVGRGYDRIVEQLLEAGANPMAVDHHGKTPMDMARATHHEHLLQLLYGFGGQEPMSSMKVVVDEKALPSTPTGIADSAQVTITPTQTKLELVIGVDPPMVLSTPPRPQSRKKAASSPVPVCDGVALRPGSIGRKRTPSSVVNEMAALLNGSFIAKLDNEIEDVDLDSSFSDSRPASPTKVRKLMV